MERKIPQIPIEAGIAEDDSQIKEQQIKKQQIRKQVLAIRDGMHEETRKRLSYQLTEQILKKEQFGRAKQLLCFVSFGSEIDTTVLIQKALETGKKVFVPKVEGVMNFYRISSFHDLQEGYMKILEPDTTGERFEYHPDMPDTLILVPGVAFDSQRRRLGYGKGFYDRFLGDKDMLQKNSIAIGFSCQLVEELPEEEGDIRPEKIMLAEE